MELAPGRYTVGMEFDATGTGDNGEVLGSTTLYIDDQEVASGDMRAQSGKFTLSGDGLCIGYDSGDAVSSLYETPGEFEGGTIFEVAVSISGETYENLEAEAKRIMKSH